MTISNEIPHKIQARRQGRFAKLQRTLQANGLAILRDEPGTGAFSDSSDLLKTMSGREPTVIDFERSASVESLGQEVSSAIGLGAPVAIRGIERLDASSLLALEAAFCALRSAGIPTIAVALAGKNFAGHGALVDLSGI